MFCFGLISLLNPSSSEPEFGRIRSARPEFFFSSSYFSFKHNSRIVFLFFFSGFWFFSAVIYTAVVITLTTHNLQTVRPGGSGTSSVRNRSAWVRFIGFIWAAPPENPREGPWWRPGPGRAVSTALSCFSRLASCCRTRRAPPPCHSSVSPLFPSFPVRRGVCSSQSGC